ncbi:MAG: baseplate J/gp47 family protein [Clostridiales bacterium]|jgi:uncharacterized phage protein gp47/JayE|nr:baseplate J/gp47 family protein [Clostridiales bacterium]
MLEFYGKKYAQILADQMARVPDTVDKRDISLIAMALRPESWYMEGMYLELAAFRRDSNAETATGKPLDCRAEERNIWRRGATAAAREGYFDKPVAAGARFSAIAGPGSQRYAVTEYLGPREDGFHWHRLECEEPGAAGNEYFGPLLPITAGLGLATAELAAVAVEGRDAETDEELRQRYMLSLTEQTFAGNIASYRAILLAQPEIGAVQVYPAFPAPGHVLCSVLSANYNPATAELLDRMQGMVCPGPSHDGLGMAPVGAEALIVTATPRPIAVSATLALGEGATPASVRPAAEAALEEYFLSIRRGWGPPLTGAEVKYEINAYAARVGAALLGVPGVVNALDVRLDGSPADVACAETGALQELPVLGEAILS